MKNLDSYQELISHKRELVKFNIKEEFLKNPTRFDELSFKFKNNLFFDFSGQLLKKETLKKLNKLATECNLKKWINKLYSGKKINHTEGRAALHTALREPKNDGKISQKIQEQLAKMAKFCADIHSNQWISDKKITNVINIGIGGSEWGPKFVCEALKPLSQPDIKIDFISNLDAFHLQEVLKDKNFQSTLFIISSKSFVTMETITNAISCLKWFHKQGGKEEDINKHFVAITACKKRAIDFGIKEEGIFEFWDWVGGRYSVWSTIGLPIMLQVGFDNFKKFLNGAYQMDLHFQTKEFENNIPVIMALIGIWNINFLNINNLGIFPYDYLLRNLNFLIRQCDMESNGKNVNRDGKKIDYATAPIIWGAVGSEAQHSFYQLIHQGSVKIATDAIISLKSLHGYKEHEQKLISNFIAQISALKFGRDIKTSKKIMKQCGLNEEEIKFLAPYKVFEGNRPITSILLSELSPENLGSLIALYELKIFTQSVIWNINPFDQWGVELGKELADDILQKINNKGKHNFDIATANLIKKYQQQKL
jgi:glucose-6-phosphate isomerase